MGRPRHVENPRTISLVVDGNVYDKFVESLPKQINFSEAIREHISSVVEEGEKTKKVMPPAKGAVNYIESDSYKVLSKKKQISLDVFAKDYEELNEKERTQFRIQYMNLGKQIEMIHVNENSKISKFKRLPY